MTYPESIACLNSFINFERGPDRDFNTTEADIDRFRTMLAEMDNPHYKYPVVHIAGTKGKGSTAAMIASILRAAGYKVGLFTSPHLVTVRERIKVQNRRVSKPEFARLIQIIQHNASQSERNDKRSFRTVFEHLTAAAFLHFARRKVDVAIVEAGLGGRLDATIVVDPTVSVITPIGLDHTAVLGDREEMIAREKAFVIKPGKIAVTAPQTRGVMSELIRRAEDVSASLTVSIGRDEFDIQRSRLNRTEFTWKRAKFINEPLTMRLAGLHQLDNLSNALTAVERLTEAGFNFSFKAIRDGIGNVRCQGRMQYLPGAPTVILDGSHNKLAIEALCASLSECEPNRKWRVVFSGLRGKPVKEMIEILSRSAIKLYIAPIQFPKALSRVELKEIIEDMGVENEIYPDVPSAFAAARRDCGEEEMVIATGSFYLAGEILRSLRGHPSPPSDGRIDWRI